MTVPIITALFPVQYLPCLEHLETAVVVFPHAGTVQALTVNRLSLNQRVWK